MNEEREEALGPPSKWPLLVPSLTSARRHSASISSGGSGGQGPGPGEGSGRKGRGGPHLQPATPRQPEPAGRPGDSPPKNTRPQGPWCPGSARASAASSISASWTLTLFRFTCDKRSLSGGHHTSGNVRSVLGTDLCPPQIHMLKPEALVWLCLEMWVSEEVVKVQWGPRQGPDLTALGPRKRQQRARLLTRSLRAGQEGRRPHPEGRGLASLTPRP